MRYGIPYQGSKNRIAKKLIDWLPPADTFVDVFGGGGAMTHAALLSGKYKLVIYNELNPLAYQAVRMAFSGGFKDENRWISREDFHRLNGVDPYVRYCFSFGANGRTYAYGPAIEPYKRACHYAVVFNRWEEYAKLCPETAEAAQQALAGVSDVKQRRLRFGPAVVRRIKEMGRPELLDTNPLYHSIHGMADSGSLESQARLDRLRELQILQSLERLDRLWEVSAPRLPEFHCVDYRDLAIPEGDTLVYCDPPYKGTGGYGQDFDHGAFAWWARMLPAGKVYVSEYVMPPGYSEVWSTKRSGSFAPTAGSHVTIERLFTPSPIRYRHLRLRRPKKANR